MGYEVGFFYMYLEWTLGKSFNLSSSYFKKMYGEYLRNYLHFGSVVSDLLLMRGLWFCILGKMIDVFQKLDEFAK